MTVVGRTCHHCRRFVARGQRCPCRTTKARGYDNTWRAHSARRVAEVGRCADCGATEDLTTDHPTDDVVCRSCNAARGHTTH